MDKQAITSTASVSVYLLPLLALMLLFCAPRITVVQDVDNGVGEQSYAESAPPQVETHAPVAQLPVESPAPQAPPMRGPKQSVAIYMAGTEPSALKGAYKVVGSELAKALTASPAYSAIDRTDEVLKMIEQEHVYQRSGAVDDEQIKTLGKQLGVSYLCIAEVNEVMGSYLLDARLVDVETAQVLHVVSKPGAMRDVYQLVEISQSAARELVSGGGR